MSGRRVRPAVPLLAAGVLLFSAVPAVAAPGPGPAPGAPGGAVRYLPADKAGFGTARAAASPVWFTLQPGGGTGELYYPDLGTPSVRRLSFVVVDPAGHAVDTADAPRHSTTPADGRSPLYRQVDSGPGWRLTTAYATDPARPTVVVDVRFTASTPHRLYAVYDPSLAGDGTDDTARTAGSELVASDATTATALVARPAFTELSNGYLGTSDGWTDLADGRLDGRYPEAGPGNVVQTARTALTGTAGHDRLTLVLGFGSGSGSALRTAAGSLHSGFPAVARAYAAGWHSYLAGLHVPALPAPLQRQAYLTSAMVLAASEDKRHPGAYVASPTMPWVWGAEHPTGPYHLVWSRDLYQIATALLAMGDRAGANRALDHLFTVQQKPDGSFPQNATVDGTPVWGGLQLDEVAFPIVLAYQLGRTDTWPRVRKAADFLVRYDRAPWTPQERWENQSGYSPATIASEIAALVTAAELAREHGDTASAERYLTTADAWQRRVKGWTVTTTGPYSRGPYFLRLTKDGEPNRGTTYSIGDSGPSAADQRTVLDPSFLELVRLGVLPAGDPAVVNSLRVVDRQLAVDTPYGRFWHRASFDGYGETPTGEPWFIGAPPDSFATRGRAWPLLNGERGEYYLASGRVAAARAQLATMARAVNSGRLMPEQVWDDAPPPGFRPGTPTFSATPLAWTHAQYIRLAAGIAAADVIEQPAVVACRYVRRC